MLDFFHNPSLQLSDDQKFLEISYVPKTNKPIFDICDPSGSILKSGTMTKKNMRVRIADLLDSVYVFLILDGDRIRSKKFTISR